MKKIYLSYDVIGEEIIDAFVRKNNAAAKRDFIRAFQQNSKDSTHVKLFEAYPKTADDEFPPLNVIEGIPVDEIWDSEEFLKHEEDEAEKTEN